MLTNIAELRDLTSNIGLLDVITFTILVLLVVQGLIMLCSWFLERFGIETKYTLKKKEQENLLQKISNDMTILKTDIEELKEQRKLDVKHSIEHDEKIEQSLEQTNARLINNEMSDNRWKIIDFANALSNGKRCSREQFVQIYKYHEEYEALIKQTGLTNGYEEDSFKYIESEYRRMLTEGKFKI